MATLELPEPTRRRQLPVVHQWGSWHGSEMLLSILFDTDINQFTVMPIYWLSSSYSNR